MLAIPNKTILRGKVSVIRPEPDGQGAEIELEVAENKSLEVEKDFLKTKSGRNNKSLFYGTGKLKVGDVIQAQATLLAGPFGGARPLLEKVKKLK